MWRTLQCQPVRLKHLQPLVAEGDGAILDLISTTNKVDLQLALMPEESK